jgi:hypothetical protein
MSGKERLNARISSHRDSAAKRVLVVVALIAFIAIGLALEAGWAL